MTSAASEVLRALWKSSIEDEDFTAQRAVRAARRKAISAEIMVFLVDFLAGKFGVEQFRREFDKKTRTEWDGFGLKGLSGAMVLNKLVRHLPDHRADLEHQLRRVLELPLNDTDARAKLTAFVKWVGGLIESGVATKADLQPKRIPFFVSALWYVRAPDRWPAYYESMRDQLEELGLVEESDDVVESYMRFAEVVREQSKVLGIAPWDFELLFSFARPSESIPPPKPSPAAGQRIWLWAAGRGGSAWAQFRKDGLAGIGFGGVDVGDLTKFNTLEEIRDWLQARRPDGKRPVNDALAAWQIAHDVRVGDLVYVKKGRSQVVGRGRVVGAYRFERERKPYAHVCAIKWEWDGLADAGSFLVMKTLTDITDYPNLVSHLGRVTRSDSSQVTIEEEEEEEADEGDAYDIDAAAKELFMSRSQVEKALATLRVRKNLILQGPPGVGKTFVASRLADLLIGRFAPGHKVTVQFHPSYGYEDFVQGYRATQAGGYERVNGPFLEICNKALQDKNDIYVVVIDEINRAHLGKVLGELMMLIEADKRDPGWAATLAYARPGEAPFHVPPNLHIIGTMNTADRSLAMVDYALRRRFAFIELEPAFGQANFEVHMTSRGVPAKLLKRIERRFQEVNAMLEADVTLGRGYFLGHSFVCAPPAQPGEDWFQEVVDQDLRPLLQEYWFDRRDQVEKAMEILLGEE